MLFRLGDSFSKKESLVILESISVDHHEPILALKAGVESLYLGRMMDASKRSRRAMARRMDIRGYDVMADNVGRVSKIGQNLSEV